MNSNPDTQKQPDFRRLSHDLRNALGTIYNYAQVLEMSLSKTNNEKDAAIAREIIDSVKKMEALLVQEIDSLNS